MPVKLSFIMLKIIQEKYQRLAIMGFYESRKHVQE